MDEQAKIYKTVGNSIIESARKNNVGVLAVLVPPDKQDYSCSLLCESLNSESILQIVACLLSAPNKLGEEILNAVRAYEKGEFKIIVQEERKLNDQPVLH